MDNLPAISWLQQVAFNDYDDDHVSFVLDHHAYLDFYIASLLGLQSGVEMSHHSDTLSGFHTPCTLNISFANKMYVHCNRYRRLRLKFSPVFHPPSFLYSFYLSYIVELFTRPEYNRNSAR